MTSAKQAPQNGTQPDRNNTMPDSELDAIEARANAATAGPWRWDGPFELEGMGGNPDVYEYHVGVLSINHDGGCACRSACHLTADISDPDREFIAHARQDINELAAEVRRLRATAQRVEQLADSWHARGEHDMAYSKTIPYEDIADHILSAGAEKVENARHIRNALHPEADR